jgi:phosphoribosylglycinamide formyltransferase 2
LTPGASAAYKAKSESDEPKFEIPNELFSTDTEVRVFGKPESHIGRRMAVVLAADSSAEAAKERAANLVERITEI